MEDDDPATGKIAIPPRLLAILHDVILVCISFVANQIGHTFVHQGRHVGDGSVVLQFCRGEPSHQPALMGGIAGWTESFVIIVARVHEVPVTDVFFTSTVKVREAKAVGILVADGAKGGLHTRHINLFLHTAVAVHHVLFLAIGDGNGVAIDILLKVFQVFAYPPLMRPDGVIATTGILSLSGIDDEQLVDETVAIPVVEAPVDVAGLQHLHDVLHQILRVLIMRSSAGILLGIAADLHIYQVEDGTELAVALSAEIVADRTSVGALLIVLGIENIVPQRQRSSLVALEIPVGIGHHYHQLVKVTLVEVTTYLFGLAA